VIDRVVPRHEAERPVLHFTPPRNWMNDPNGLVRVGDQYHLFYQHNPDGIDHANLHWGHATSSDLLKWTHLPVALAPDGLGEAYSGTVVIDEDDTAGFGRGALVAAFTSALPGRQSQSLAYSTDGGMTWARYGGNPVVEAPQGHVDFRDPKLVNYLSPRGERWWVMLVAAGREIWFYRSQNLKEWEHVSVFAPERPWPGATLEVPELLQVPVVGESRSEWVLLLSVHERLPDGTIASEALWAPGHFDGLGFESAYDLSRMRRLDCGPSFYAPLGWQSGPNGAPVIIGWMDERDRYLVPPAREWCGRMSLPRELMLQATPAGYALIQTPILPVPPTSERWLDQVNSGGTVRMGELPSVFSLSLRSAASPNRIRLILQSLADESECFELGVEGPQLAMQTWGRTGSPPVIVEAGETDPFVLEIIVDTGSIEVCGGGVACVASFITGVGIGPVAAELRNDSEQAVEISVVPLAV
jgi:sucrose-6-phosphate hydrolase SacC (GH32 family)